MTATEINAQLYRPLMSGYQYDRYFPNSTCSVTNLATGNTKVAINEMAKWAKKYAHHCADLAPVLASNSLENTVNNIQDFLYNHIQYSIDGENQNLKSPACAWSTRKEGTDCKSYSIFGSAILLQLGIKHYLRRIKQEAVADAYTHVYLVIPINQKTGKLNDGYYTIDGTIKYNTELPFTQKDDIYMEPRLAINGLAAALGCGNNTNCGCGGHNKIGVMGYSGYTGLAADFSMQNQITPEAIEGFYEFIDLMRKEGIQEQVLLEAVENMKYFVSVGIEPTIEQVFTLSYSSTGLGFIPVAAILPASKLTLASVTKIAGLVGSLFKQGGVFSKIFGSIDCIGGSAFGGGDLQTALDQQTSFVTKKVEAINRAVLNGDINSLANEAMEFIAANEMSYKGMTEKLTQGWNSCTTKNLKTFIQNLEFFNNYANKALEAWLNEYFIVKYGANKNFKGNSFPVATYVTNHLNYHNDDYPRRTMILEIKPTTRDIRGFELNETIIAQGEQKRFDQNSFLQSLQEIIAIVDVPTPQQPGSNFGTDYDNDLGSNKEPKQAGSNIGMILMAGVAVGAIVYGTTKMKK